MLLGDQVWTDEVGVVGIDGRPVEGFDQVAWVEAWGLSWCHCCLGRGLMSRLVRIFFLPVFGSTTVHACLPSRPQGKKSRTMSGPSEAGAWMSMTRSPDCGLSVFLLDTGVVWYF